MSPPRREEKSIHPLFIWRVPPFLKAFVERAQLSKQQQTNIHVVKPFILVFVSANLFSVLYVCVHIYFFIYIIYRYIHSLLINYFGFMIIFHSLVLIAFMYYFITLFTHYYFIFILFFCY